MHAVAEPQPPWRSTKQLFWVLKETRQTFFFFFFAVTRQKLRPSQIREVPFVITGHQLWRPLRADVSGLPRMHGHVRCCLAGLQSSLQAGKPLNWPVQMSCQSSNTPDAGVLIKQVHEMVGERTKSFLLL